MGRSRLKFRDVVKISRGGNKKGGKRKFNQTVHRTITKKKKPSEKYTNQRKHHDFSKKSGFQQKKSRGQHFKTEKSAVKQFKVNEPKQLPPEESSESEEEEMNPLQKLRLDFTNGLQSNRSEAIDSDSSSSSAIEESDDNQSEIDESQIMDLDPLEVNDLEQSNNESDKEDDNLDEHTLYESEDEEENKKQTNDNFIKRYTFELHENLLSNLQNPSGPVMDIHHLNWPKFGPFVVQIPHYNQAELLIKSTKKLEDTTEFATSGILPQKIDCKIVDLVQLSVKKQICDNVVSANPILLNEKVGSALLSPLQCELFSVLNNYQDLFYSRRTLENAEEIRFVYCLHVANHVLKTRLKVLRHNLKLAKKDEVPEEYRDQGLVRPKVLILLPFRSAAYKTIQMIADILLIVNKGNIINRKRFTDEYTGDTLSMPKRNPKPEDFEQTFSGNTNDDFRIGLSVTKKCLKLYTDFYSSDIIVASPLGLRTLIGAEGEAQRDYDFLASIELLVFDQTEIFLMQNWDHILHLFNHMHLQPQQSHDTDFSRVRTWCLNGWMKYYRQTVIFSSVVLPEMNAIFNRRCCNYWGKIRVGQSLELGTIGQVVVQLPHLFRKFYANSVTDSIEKRYEFFVKKILPQQMDQMMRQTVVFVANYFDYVRLRNYFKREDIGFVQICEYSKDNKVARARDIFFHGDKHFLLYTERYHFFNRIRLKGIRHLVFYNPPNFPHFYYEMCNLMQEVNLNRKIGTTSNMTVTVLYSKYDVHQLSAIVGTEKISKMLQSDQDVHMMVTGTDS